MKSPRRRRTRLTTFIARIGPGSMLVLWSALGCAAPAGNASPDTVAEAYAGRTLLVHLPQRMVPGSALVVVLHGGFGNAERISARRSEGGLNLDDAADAAGFIVA